MKKQPEQTSENFLSNIIISIVIILIGLIVFYFSILLYTGWTIEPRYIGKVIAIIGVLILGYYLMKWLKIKKYTYVVLFILLIGSNIGIDEAAKWIHSRKADTAIKGGTEQIESEIIKVKIKQINRKGNPYNYPYIAVKYNVQGKDIKQRIAVLPEDTFNLGQKIKIEYAITNPKICRLIR